MNSCISGAHRNFSMDLSEKVDPEAIQGALDSLHESRLHAVRLVIGAAAVRPEVGTNFLPLGVGEHSFGLGFEALVEEAKKAPHRLGTAKTIDLPQLPADLTRVHHWDHAELARLLDASVKELMATNQALSALAANSARQLVGHPGKLATGIELSQLLGISEEAVRQRHQAGKLIAILKHGRERGRGFPVFQSWVGIVGRPLEQILGVLGYRVPTGARATDEAGASPDAAEVFQFFIGRNDLLGGFTPVEVLTGVSVQEPSDEDAMQLLGRPDEERLALVLGAARAEAEQRHP